MTEEEQGQQVEDSQHQPSGTHKMKPWSYQRFYVLQAPPEVQLALPPVVEPQR